MAAFILLESMKYMISWLRSLLVAAVNFPLFFFFLEGVSIEIFELTLVMDPISSGIRPTILYRTLT